MRGDGTCAFICATILSGQAITLSSIDVIVWLHAALLGVTACCQGTAVEP